MTRPFWGIVSGLALAAGVAAPAPGQSSGLPETYSFLSTNSMIGPEMTVKVNRNGSKELIERTVVPKPGSSNRYHDRVLYDFQAHRIYTVDLNTQVCSTQAYTSPYAPSQLDPIGAAKEMQDQIAANPPRALGLETVNGMRANVLESAGAEMRSKVWLDEKLKFLVKALVIRGNGPGITVFEMRQLSYGPSPASLFTAPSGCTQIGGESNANGGHAEMTVEVQTPAQTREPGGGNPRAGNQPGNARAGSQRGNARAESQPRTASPKDASMGKWEVGAKDGKGVAWSGTLTVGDLEPDQFEPNPAKYNHLCDLRLESPEGGGRGRQTPCLFNAQTRTLTFGSDGQYDRFSYSVVLSPDGKSLVQGRWTEKETGTGTWSARLAGAPAAPTGSAAAPRGNNAWPPPGPARMAPTSNPVAKVTAVKVQAAEEPYNGPCGKKLEVSGSITTDGPATIWYRFYANVAGVDFTGGQDGTFAVNSAGTATIAKNATFAQSKSGEMRIQAAVQNADGRHGGVTISNVVPFRVTCGR